MMWFFLVLIGVCSIPVTIELTRQGLTEATRSDAPGKFALLSQGSTHYEWLGPERGPIAVCIHGLTTPSFVWRGVAKGLALMGFRVLVYDLYGRGFSERARGKQDAEFFLTQLSDLLTHENARGHITLLGYSMGGAIAAHFAARHPHAIKQLILLAPAGMHPLGGGKLALVRDLPVLGDWLFLLFYPLELRKGIREEKGQPSSVRNIDTLQHLETDRRGFFPAVLSSLRGILRHTAEEQHRTIAAAGVPVLAIWGDQDAVIPLSSKDTLAAWNPQAKQVVIEGAAHAVTYSHTDLVIDAIRVARA